MIIIHKIAWMEQRRRQQFSPAPKLLKLKTEYSIKFRYFICLEELLPFKHLASAEPRI